MPLNHHHTPEVLAGIMAAIGGVIGLGQLMASQEKLTPRLILGRTIVSAGLGAASASVLVWFPELPPLVSYGLAAAFATVGTAGIEKLLGRIFGRYPR